MIFIESIVKLAYALVLIEDYGYNVLDDGSQERGVEKTPSPTFALYLLDVAVGIQDPSIRRPCSHSMSKLSGEELCLRTTIEFRSSDWPGCARQK